MAWNNKVVTVPNRLKSNCIIYSMSSVFSMRSSEYEHFLIALLPFKKWNIHLIFLNREIWEIRTWLFQDKSMLWKIFQITNSTTSFQLHEIWLLCKKSPLFYKIQNFKLLLKKIPFFNFHNRLLLVILNSKFCKNYTVFHEKRK